MADGGASTMIILVASLIVSGAASVVLIDSWGSLAEASGHVTSKRSADAETDVSIGGDRSNVLFTENAGDDEITLYFVNSGSTNIDMSDYAVFVDGTALGTGDSSTLYPSSGTIWGPGSVLEVVVSDSSFEDYVDDQIVTVMIVVNSEVSSGFSGTSTANEEVRLNV